MFDLQPFPLDGHAYRIRDIPEPDSARIWAGLHGVAPHLLVMVPVESDEPDDEAMIQPFVEAVRAALWKMRERDRAVVVATCLGNVERRTVLRWRPIRDRVTGRLLYDDITLDVFSILALRVLCRVAVERSGKPPVRLRVAAA